MTLSRRRKLFWSLFGAASLLLLAAAAVPEPENEMVVAHKWASNHQAELPTSVLTIATYPRAYRKAILHNMSVERRERIWRAQMEIFLTPPERRSSVQQAMVKALGFELNESQRRYVRRVIDSLHVRAFAPGITLPQRQVRAKEDCDSALSVFDKRAASLIFATLGPPDDGLRESPVQRVNEAGVAGGVIALLRAVGARLGLATRNCTCSCNQNSWCDCTGIGMYCTQCYPACPDSGNCCGCQGWFACNGSCRLDT